MADDNVNVQFGATVDGAIAGINKVTQALEGFGANIEGLKGPLAAMGEAAVAAFAFEKIEQWTERVVDAGVELAKIEAQTGDTAQQANVLAFAAEGSDVQLTLLARTMGQFAKQAEESQGKTSGAAQAFKTMGINVQELLAQGKSMNDIFQLTVEKLATYKDSLNKTAIESLVMGGRSAQLALALKELGTNYEEMNAAVERSGITIKDFDSKARETKAGLVEAEMASQGFSNNLFVIFKPAIDAAILGWRGFVEGMNSSMQKGEPLWYLLEGITGALLVLETVAIGVAATIRTVFDILVTGMKAALDEVQGAGNALVDMAHGKFTQAMNDIKTGHANAVAELAAGGKKIDKDNDDTLTHMQKAWSTYWNDTETQAKEGAKKVSEGMNAPGITPDPTAAMNADIEAHKKILDEEIALVGSNLQAKMILEQNYYDWLKSKYPQNANAMAEAGRKIAQTQEQEVKQSEASWQRFFGSFNSGIMGMLRGTESFKQALAKTFGNIIELGLKMIEKLVAHWIVGEIQKTAATNAGNVARIASDKAGAAAGKAAQVAEDSTSILNAAKTGAANAYASTAAIPIIGPILAPAAAAVAFGAIAAFDSFETGTPYVPKTGPYILHEGEEVRPAGVKDSGGGGGQVHFHVSAMDSQSVAQFFNSHGDKIAQQVMEQFKRGNKSFRYPRS